MNIVWKPNPGPQTWALQKTEREILYGGARGGGKTDAGMVWIAEPTKYKFYQGLVLRRNAVDLSDWIRRAKALYSNIGGRFVNGKDFQFPSGAMINTGHLAEEDSYEKYQGHEYQRELVEELTHIPSEDLYLKVLGSNRSKYPEIPAQMFATTNPGGPGHRWVKARFVDLCPTYRRKYTDEDGIEHEADHCKTYTSEFGLTRIFVPAKVEDNPFLYKNDPDYVAYLNSLPEDLKQAWRFGSWDSYEIKGAFYTNELRQATNEGRITKVPFDASQLVHTWWDLGAPQNTFIWFFQQLGLEWHAIDCYVGNIDGPAGIAHYSKVLKEKSDTIGYVYGKHWAPHDIAATEFSTGQSRIEVAKQHGIHFNIAPKYSFEDGIDAARRIFTRVWFDEVKCDYGINALRNYRRKWNNRLGQFEPVDEHDWSSHPSDAFRYFGVTNMPYQAKTSVLTKRRQLEESEEPFDKYKIFQ